MTPRTRHNLANAISVAVLFAAVFGFTLAFGRAL